MCLLCMAVLVGRSRSVKNAADTKLFSAPGLEKSKYRRFSRPTATAMHKRRFQNQVDLNFNRARIGRYYSRPIEGVNSNLRSPMLNSLREWGERRSTRVQKRLEFEGGCNYRAPIGAKYFVLLFTHLAVCANILWFVCIRTLTRNTMPMLCERTLRPSRGIR